MKVAMKQNPWGHIEIWLKDHTDGESDIYLQAQEDVEAMIDEIGPDSAREIKNGWTIIDQEIDDLWKPDKLKEDGE